MPKFINEQYIDAPLEKVWEFFSNTDNLKLITPPQMRLKILHTDLPIKAHMGQIIKYKVSPMLGIPLNWITEITEVKEGEMFADEQKKGPYKYWRHEHYFKKQGNGTLMIDIVNYELPLFIPKIFTNMLGIEKKNYRNI